MLPPIDNTSISPIGDTFLPERRASRVRRASSPAARDERAVTLGDGHAAPSISAVSLFASTKPRKLMDTDLNGLIRRNVALRPRTSVALRARILDVTYPIRLVALASSTSSFPLPAIFSRHACRAIFRVTPATSIKPQKLVDTLSRCLRLQELSQKGGTHIPLAAPTCSSCNFQVPTIQRMPVGCILQFLPADLGSCG